MLFCLTTKYLLEANLSFADLPELESHKTTRERTVSDFALTAERERTTLQVLTRSCLKNGLCVNLGRDAF